MTMPATDRGTLVLLFFLFTVVGIDQFVSSIDGIYQNFPTLRLQRHEVASPTKSLVTELLSDSQAYTSAECLRLAAQLTAR